jgi:hypothetical protein
MSMAVQNMQNYTFIYENTAIIYGYLHMLGAGIEKSV